MVNPLLAFTESANKLIVSIDFVTRSETKARLIKGSRKTQIQIKIKFENRVQLSNSEEKNVKHSIRLLIEAVFGFRIFFFEIFVRIL